MNGQKISSAVLNSKTVKEYLTFASAVMSAVLEPQRLVDKVATKLTDPQFVASDDQIQWLLSMVEAVVCEHVRENAKDGLIKVQVGFDLAGLAGLTVGDVMGDEVKEAADE
jgi:hypothetical protein